LLHSEHLTIQSRECHVLAGGEGTLNSVAGAMSDTIEVHLTLTRDKPNSTDGFERLARYFLKMARRRKSHGRQ
jgi:hypothetical protein